MSERGRWGPEGPPPEAYSRVTNAERFRPLHTAMLEIISRLERDFEVERKDGYGLDEKLERGQELARPSVGFNPRNSDAAPIAVAFSTFPGVHVRFGRWRIEPFPGCGCDACDESAEGEIDRLTEMVDGVTAGRFREAIHCPVVSLTGSGWIQHEFRWPDGRFSRGESRVNGQRARELSGDRRRLELDWKPWRRSLAPQEDDDV